MEFNCVRKITEGLLRKHSINIAVIIYCSFEQQLINPVPLILVVIRRAEKLLKAATLSQDIE
jgi:hypothetical protein